jgi:hypothetical protein
MLVDEMVQRGGRAARAPPERGQLESMASRPGRTCVVRYGFLAIRTKATRSYDKA